MSGSQKSPSASNLAGEAVLVTGAAAGIGKAIATRLFADGAKVAVMDIQDDIGIDFVSRLSPEGKDAIYVSCDVRDRIGVKVALTKVSAVLGPLTALVNNAGIGIRSPFLAMDDEQWNTVISVNLSGAFIVGQEVAKGMAATRHGSIVNVSSISAHLAHSELTAYSVSKAGLLALTRMMAFELAPVGIRVNAVTPGTIDTEFVSKMMSETAKIERFRRIPMARFGTPEEVAGTVAFLLSKDAQYITGESIVIDGGVVFGGIRS
jgi:NAD(P)-dependent dehydrogenase (short-subunit alcohol dehydrogenase family)